MKKQKENVVHAQLNSVSFTGSYTEDEPNFPRQNNLISLTEKGVWHRQAEGCKFQGLFKT